jgi:hypothetical protein
MPHFLHSLHEGQLGGSLHTVRGRSAVGTERNGIRREDKPYCELPEGRNSGCLRRAVLAEAQATLCYSLVTGSAFEICSLLAELSSVTRLSCSNYCCCCCDRDGVVSIVTGLLAGQPKDRVSIPDRDERCFSSPTHLERL